MLTIKNVAFIEIRRTRLRRSSLTRGGSRREFPLWISRILDRETRERETGRTLLGEGAAHRAAAKSRQKLIIRDERVARRCRLH